MFIHYNIPRILNKNFTIHTKKLHSLQQKKFTKPFRKKPAKKKIEETHGPKLYMRDKIQTISKLLRTTTWESTQQKLSTLPITYDSYTINQVLKTHPPMEKAWLFFNWASKLKPFKHDQFTYTTMLDIFGEAGRISSMKFIFQEMKDKGVGIDAVTYTSMLHWLGKDGDLEGAVRMWEDMKGSGCGRTVVSYTAFMKVLFDHGRGEEGRGVYKEMIEAGCTPNCQTYTVLMEFLAKTGKFKQALEIMSKMQEAGVQPDKAACNILVLQCSRAGQTSALHHVLQYMKENALVLRHPIYREALEALKKAGESDELLREVNPHLSFEGMDVEDTPECETFTTDVWSATDRAIIINLMARRNFVAVEHMLNILINKKILLDSKLISAIIHANCVNHRPACALLAFNYGVEMGIYIERPACLALLGFFIRTNSFSELVEIVEKMVAGGVSLGTYLLSLVIYKLGGTQMSDSCERVFSSLHDDQKNTATYTALMGAYFCSNNVEKGIETFDTMRRNDIQPSSGTYRLLILGLKKAGRVRDAGKYYKEKKSVQKNGLTQESITMEGQLCDLIFAGDLAWC